MKNFIRKIGLVGTGVLGTEVVNHGFDFLLYPLAIAFLGPLVGGSVMTLLAMVLNYLLVLAYHRTKYDWFGFEWLALKRQEEGRGLVGKLLRVLFRLGHWPVYVFLCWEDPFKAFIFVRGRKADGFRFDRADWVWFFFTNLLGNLIWVLLLWGVIDLVKGLF